jgi:hypothetical protein
MLRPSRPSVEHPSASHRRNGGVWIVVPELLYLQKVHIWRGGELRGGGGVEDYTLFQGRRNECGTRVVTEQRG